MVLEPGPHGEEGEVHRGGGGEEGGAREEHPGAGHHHAQTQPPYISSELAQYSTIKVNLKIKFKLTIRLNHTSIPYLTKCTNKSQKESQEVED